MSWTLTKNWTIICGSRRDQEEGGGTGPSLREPPRRDQTGIGRWSWAQKVGPPFVSVVPRQQLCYRQCHFVTLLRTATVETVVSGVH